VDAPPVKVFDRTPNLAGAQIISYRVSGDGKWCVLIGITPGLPERCAGQAKPRLGSEEARKQRRSSVLRS
jgi:hypothetical protein